MQELLWKYAEGNCSQAEKAKVERLVANDANLQFELESILEVQTHLTSMEAHSPSIRFTQNVMDQIPEGYFTIAEEPLIKPIWMKVFIGLIAASFAAILFIPKSSTAASSKLPYQESFTQFINSFVAGLPSMTVQFSAMVILSLALLLVIDKMMLKRVRGFLLV